MNIIKAYGSGWAQVFRNWKLWLLLFATNVLFALTSALPFFKYFNAKIGDSLALDMLLERFDFGIISDFLTNYGFGLSILTNQSAMMIVLYLLLSVFLMGGIVKTAQNPYTAYESGEFWAASARYFWRFFRLTFYFLIIHGLLLFGFVTLLGQVSSGDIRSENTILSYLKIFGVIYLFLMSIVSLIQDYAKIHIVETNPKLISKSILNSLSFVFKNFGRTFFLMLLNAFTLILFYGIFKMMDLNIYANTGFTVFLLFVVGQLFILSRIALKIQNMASDYLMYNSLHSVDEWLATDVTNQPREQSRDFS